jgi:hypothetical protein
MSIGRIVVAWIARHMLALLVILLILIAGRLLLPPLAAWYERESEIAATAPSQRDALAAVQQRFADYAGPRRAEAAAALQGLSGRPAAALRERRAAIEREKARETANRLSRASLLAAAATGDGDRLFAHYRAGAELALLDREARAIDALLNLRVASQQRAALEARRRWLVADFNRVGAIRADALARARALDERPLAGVRNLACRGLQGVAECPNYRAARAARTLAARALARQETARREVRLIDARLNALRAADAVSGEAESAFAAGRRSIADELAAVDATIGSSWRLWLGRQVREALPTALLILALVILGPVAIKALLYFVVAPAASRRSPVRLLADDKGWVQLGLGDGPRSAVSQRLGLDADSELLIVPEAVQSSPHAAEKRTKWLLRWSMPLSSLASGLVGLMRIRGRSPDFVLASATHDPLAEIGIVTIAAGSAMIVKPRALRGLVQPLGRPVRITRRWRLGHLSAWLTMQLRFLIFHGPCTLIVQGRRGVRLERAGGGRGVNQASTLGFSAGLLYSVRRSEAFGAYLMGRQELLNDSFDGEAGYYLFEELPRDPGRGSIWGRGLQGLGDAALKVFGI